MTEQETPRLILVGGFLGAGKTTLLLHTARTLVARGHRVGLVTNDQGDDLVDTALAAQRQMPVVEVAGGCFCCRFPDLIASLHHLRDTVNPDVILAEPVGSCTDLMATVLRPLTVFHADEYRIAPLTVLLDGSLPAPHPTSAQPASAVPYLQRKQLAEAELILLNKADQLTEVARTERMRLLQQHHAPTQVLAASARTGDGVDAWLDTVMTQSSQLARTLAIDYRQYAAAEAEFGWLNVQGALRAQHDFSAQNWLTHLLRLLDATLQGQDASIAHIKAHVTTPQGALKASLTQSGGDLTWDEAPEHSETDRLQFILNARVNAAPGTLERSVRQAFAEVTPAPAFRYDFTHFECFSPRPPQPTYRIVGAGD